MQRELKTRSRICAMIANSLFFELTAIFMVRLCILQVKTFKCLQNRQTNVQRNYTYMWRYCTLDNSYIVGTTTCEMHLYLLTTFELLHITTGQSLAEHMFVFDGYYLLGQKY